MSNGSRLHRWGTDGVCNLCGVKALEVSVNGGLFCAGSPEARAKPSDDGVSIDPNYVVPGNAGGFGLSGPVPTTPGTPTTQQNVGHDWDAQGFCKFCRLGMYAVKTLNLPCHPVPGAAGGIALPLSTPAIDGHSFGPDGACVSCGVTQVALSHFAFGMACATVRRLLAPSFCADPPVIPYTPPSPYLVQAQQYAEGLRASWEDFSEGVWRKVFWNAEKQMVEWSEVNDFDTWTG